MSNEFNFYFNSQSRNTPNHNKTTSKYGEDSILNFSGVPFPHSNNNESNGIEELKEITDENILLTKFNYLESSIENYCLYYVSLNKIFNSSNITIKNKLLQYVTEFNDSCKNFAEVKANQCIEKIKNSEIKSKLREDLNQTKVNFNNLQKKYQEEKEEHKKEIDEYKTKLNKLNEQNKRLNNKKEDLEKKIIQKEREMYKLREDFKNTDQISQDCLTYSYALGGKTEEIDINIDFPSKKDFDSISSKFEKMQNNFNTYVKWLVDTSNRTLEQYKKIYFKIKGKEWLDINNSFIKVHNLQIYNIDQDFSWTNIKNIHNTLNSIINEIFELINPTQNYDDPKKLNEDACEFLLDLIIGLKKIFLTQKHILEASFNKGNNFEEKKQI